MFVNDITATQKVAVQTETSPALPKSAPLRLRSEAGATDRANSLLGNLTINHSPTKEFGGGWRHVVRMNLRAQGTIPGASAYLVVVHKDSVDGEARAISAFNSLMTALPQLDGVLTLPDGLITSDGVAEGFHNTVLDEDVTVQWAQNYILASVMPRLLGRES